MAETFPTYSKSAANDFDIIQEKTHKVFKSVGIITEKKVANIMARGEIARFEQFLLLSECFQKSSAAESSESVYMWERVN